jgi:hypothetical protein
MATNRRRRKRKGAVRKALGWIWQHLFLVFAILMSLTVSLAIRLWLGIDFVNPIYTASITLVLMLILYWVFNFGYGAVYLIFGLHPVTGRRKCIYVGLTTQKPWTDNDGVLRHPRIEQHILGSDYYETPQKVWADTVTDWRFSIETRWMPGVKKRPGHRGEYGPVLNFLETVYIRLFLPLYNNRKNSTNRRRIVSRVAQAQRAERDAGIATPAYRAGYNKYIDKVSPDYLLGGD